MVFGLVFWLKKTTEHILYYHSANSEVRDSEKINWGSDGIDTLNNSFCLDVQILILIKNPIQLARESNGTAACTWHTSKTSHGSNRSSVNNLSDITRWGPNDQSLSLLPVFNTFVSIHNHCFPDWNMQIASASHVGNFRIQIYCLITGRCSHWMFSYLFSKQYRSESEATDFWTIKEYCSFFLSFRVFVISVRDNLTFYNQQTL